MEPINNYSGLILESKFDWLFESPEGDLLDASIRRNFKCDKISSIGWDYTGSTMDRPVYLITLEYSKPNNFRSVTKPFTGDELLNLYKEEIVREMVASHQESGF